MACSLRREKATFPCKEELLYQDLVRELQHTPSFRSTARMHKLTHSGSYMWCKSSLKEDKVVVCVDFAEN